MQKHPRISIVTPSYNQAAYLEDTIQSVLNQDYPNLEYILIDGGSTDGSLEIIERYTDKLAYWVSEPDEGQASAINKGLARSTGEIVAWLNSDDIYLPGAFKQALEAFHSNPELGFIYGDLQSIDSSGQVFHTIKYARYSLDDLLAFRIIGQPTVFMRREVLEQTDLLDASYHYLLDHHLWLRLARVSQMKYIPATRAAARHHPAAKNIAEAGSFGEEIYRLLEWAQTQPDLNAIMSRQHRRVWGGAHRLSARYLLDGGLPAQSLKFYAKALLQDPVFTLRHTHRILYALISLVGLGGIWKGSNR
jgi:glycosyltransferase involved in cell wall biosynthesis